MCIGLIVLFVVGTFVVGPILDTILEKMHRDDQNRNRRFGTADQYDYIDGGGGPDD
jgi:hypothetical protein